MSTGEMNASELVTAPRFDARDGLALGTQIGAVAREQVAKRGRPLPDPIARALVGLEAGRGGLEAALVAVAPPVDTKRTRGADRRVDDFHAGLSTFLASFVRLPADVPEAAEGERLLGVLYPEGIGFTQATYHREWAESKVVLERIAAEKLEPAIRRLGGGVFLDGLVAAHAAYGEALGVTAAKPASADPITLRAPLDAFRAALKRFILVTAAHGEDEADPGAKALAEALLAPIVELGRRLSSRRAPVDEAPDGAPVPPATAPASA